MGRLLVWGTILLVLVSGCTAAPVTTERSPTGTQTDSILNTGASTTTTESTSATPAPTPTATAAPTAPPPDNPWRTAPIVIGIDSSADPGRNYTGPVIEAVEYWHANGAGHTAWSPNFTVHPEARSPDIVIRFVNEIGRCGREDGGVAVGCARVLDPSATPREPEVVRINLGLTNQSTYRVVRHELGHTLGLHHGEGPVGVMTEYDAVFNRVVRVAVVFETTAEYEKRDTRTQLQYVFEYYSSGADGFLSEHVEFAVIEDRAAADVIIQVNEGGSESNAAIQDGVFVIEVNGIRTDHRGWHVGAWFGFYFGANSTSELPPPFDEPESDPRSQWWH